MTLRGCAPQLEALTDHNEKKLPEQWAVSDAPHAYTEKLIEAVVGIEIVISKLSGKWKVSQNQPPQNQSSVIDGLENSGLPDAAAMAELVRLRSVQ
ncbi:MAG: FMN-binding negative transcriptional regulator [Nitrosomonadales bacterium]